MSKQFLVLLLVCLALSTACWPAQTSLGADTEAAAQALADGRAALDRGDAKQALAKCEEALRLFEPLHDKAGMAQGLYYLGKAHYQLHHSDKAQACLERARTLHEELADRKAIASDLTGLAAVAVREKKYAPALELAGQALGIHQAFNDRKEIAATLRIIGQAYLQLGKYSEASEYGLKSLALAQELNDKNQVKLSRITIAYAHERSGQYAQALEDFRHLSEVEEELGDKLGMTQSFTRMGMLYTTLGDPDRALEAHRKSLQLAEETRDKLMIGGQLINIGTIYETIGNYAEALKYFQTALPLCREARDDKGVSRSLMNIGLIYRNLGDYTQALDYYQKSLVVAEAMKSNKMEISATYHNMGVIYSRLGHYEKALDYFQKELQVVESVHYKRGIPASLLSLGVVYEQQGNSAKALEYIQKALKLSEETGDKHLTALCHLNTGTIYYRSKDMAAAQRELTSALQLSRQIEDAETLWMALHRQGEVLRDTGNTGEALAAMKEAVDVVERIRGHVPLAEQRADFLKEKFEVYDHLIGLLSAAQNAPDAFYYAEKAKARAFLDLLAEARGGVHKRISSDMLEKENKALARLVILQRRWQQQVSYAHDAKTAKTLEAEWREAEREHQNLKLEIRRTSPDYAAIKYPEPVNLAQAQQLLGDREVMLEYLLGQNGSFLFAVTDRDFALYPLPAREELEKKVEAFGQLLERAPTAQSTLSYARAAYDLYALLVKPAEKQLAGKRALLIVPDGALALLSFSALLTKRIQPAGVIEQSLPQWPYLVRGYDISYIQSASVLQTIKQMKRAAPPEKRLVGFAPITFDASLQVAAARSENTDPIRAELDEVYRGGVALGSLPYTRRELEWVRDYFGHSAATLYLEKDATKEKVQGAEMQHYGYVHFATHGIIHSDRPEFSSLVLRTERGEDGFLQLAEIFNLALNADLVVLSACETGKGKRMRGEGLIGLTRGFMYAGASSVLASLWNIRDQSTAYFMREFYKNLDRRGKAEALRQAQLEFIKGAQKELVYYSHPHYWSAFVLMGER